MTGRSVEAVESADGYGIRAAERVCDILDALSRSTEPVGLADVAAACNLPKSSAFRYLATLEARRYVERDEQSDGFQLGIAVASLQSNRALRLTARARPLLERLRDEFEETTNLGILDGTRVAYLDIVESPRSMRLAARPGDRDYLHCTALGKAIAAQLDPERVQAALDAEGMPRRTSRTITSRPKLLQELRKTAEAGYAVDDGENEDGGRCVAVAIPGASLAAISVSAPDARLPVARVPDVARAIRSVVEELADLR